MFVVSRSGNFPCDLTTIVRGKLISHESLLLVLAKGISVKLLTKYALEFGESG